MAALSGCDGESEPTVAERVEPRDKPAEPTAALSCPGGARPSPRDATVCTGPGNPKGGEPASVPDSARFGGGYRVFVRGVKCIAIKRTLRLFAAVPPAGRKQGFVRNDLGWACLARRERRLGPYSAQCFRGRSAYVTYLFSP